MERFTMPELLDSDALVEGEKSDAYISISKTLESIGIQVKETCLDDKDIPSLYCYINSNTGNIDDSFSYEKIEKLALKMAKKRKGRMVYITRNTTELVTEKEDKELFAKNAEIICWWKNLAAQMAKYNVLCNILEIGYAPYLGSKISCEEDIYISQLVIRRPVLEQDVRCALNYLLSKDTSYVVGTTITLDGGLKFGQVVNERPIGKNLKHCKQEITNNPFSLSGKVALVFGCSSGIGRSTALELAKRGATVSMAARRIEKLTELQNEIGENSIAVQTDISNLEDVENAINNTWNKYGKIDFLIYSAGQGYLVDDANISSNLPDMFKINFEGYVRACEKLVNLWKEHRIHGRIVAVSTVDVERVPSSHLGCYSITKAALTQYTKNLAFSCAKYGIRANCVMPGYIDTEMLKWTKDSYRKQWISRIPMQRLGISEDVAGTICYLASPAADYITGANIPIDGGYLLGYYPEF